MNAQSVYMDIKVKLLNCNLINDIINNFNNIEGNDLDNKRNDNNDSDINSSKNLELVENNNIYSKVKNNINESDNSDKIKSINILFDKDNIDNSVSSENKSSNDDEDKDYIDILDQILDDNLKKIHHYLISF